MKAPAFVMFAVLAVASAAGICQRTTCDYSPDTNSQGATYFRTTIYSTSHPDLENFRCGKAGGSNDCECHCDSTYQCTLLHDADGDGPRETKSLHHCELAEKAVPVLLQLKLQSPVLQSEWAALTDQTTDSELSGLGLGGVTMVGSALTEMNLKFKQLSGPIPSFAANTALTKLALNRNALTGPIPSFAANTAIGTLKLQGNQLSGPIPSFAANTALTDLRLFENQLTGPIPSFEANTALEILHLNDNKLTGSIPSFAHNIVLEKLSLFNNQLTDPQGWKLNTANYVSSCHVDV